TNLHDMLRVNYHLEDNAVIQEIMPLDTCVCEINEFNVDEDLDQNISEIMDNAINSLDVYDNLMDISMIRFEGKSYLVFVIHHLIVDGVSWSTILDDLTHIYNKLVSDSEIDLRRPYPYKLWVNDVKTLLDDISEEEKEHWIEINSLLDDSDIKGKSKQFVFAVENASYDSNNILMLSEEEYLALGIARAYKKTYGRNIIFNRESYGRDESLADVNRTVGWFTSKYPVFVDVGDDYDSISLISDVYKLKKAFNEIKNLGLNYSSLIYTAHEMEFKHCPVTFNFLSSEFEFKNSLFKSCNMDSSLEQNIEFETTEDDYYGIDLNISQEQDKYLVSGNCADDTYLGEKLSKFIDNICFELEFLSGYGLDESIVCPLSEVQLGIYLDEKVKDKGVAYSTMNFVECDSNHTVGEIKEAIVALIKKHPVLKGRVVDNGDMPLLVCDSVPDIDIIHHNDYDSIINPFNLEKSLSNFFIIDNDDEKGIFFNIHHIISDATSESIVVRDLLDALDGNLDEEVDLGFVYASRNSFESQFKPVYESAHEFFEKQFADIAEVNKILADVSGITERVSLPVRGIRQQVEDFTGNMGITVGSFLNAIFAYAYSRFVGSDKVYYTFTEHGRHEEYNKDALGMYIRTIPVLVDCRNDSVENFLNYFSDLNLDSMLYGVYPFRLLAREFDLNIDVSFEYNFNLNDVSHIGEDMLIEPIGDLVSEFLCVINDLDDGYLISLEHSDKYSSETAIRFVEVYREILTQILDAENLEDIDYVSESDLELLDSYNQTEYPLDYNDILEAFNDNLEKYPDNKLVSFKDSCYSYAEGAFISDKVAKALTNLGITEQDNVAFFVDRSELYMFSVLSILSLGAVFVPLDTTLPDERLEYIIKDTSSKVVLVDDNTFKRANELFKDSVILNISGIVGESIGTLNKLDISSCDVAAILYTSGSTGVPKGVKITRKSILNVAEYYARTYDLSSDDVYGLYPSIGFDAGCQSIFKAIFAGACLSIVPEEIRLDMAKLNSYFISQDITHTIITTQVGKLFAESVGNTSLKYLFVGGEKLGEFESPDNYILVDEYGPTETNNFITSIKNRDKLDYSSIGYLNYNSKMYILDNDLRRVPCGAVGELYLAGHQVANGYLNNNEETLNAFIENPFDGEGYEVMYRTGDLVRLLPDGSLAIVGRRDSQVKIRGNRVELSEIESAIRNIDGIADVTVQTVDYNGANELVAYVVVSGDIGDDLLRNTVCDYVSEHKPDYMVPAFVIRLDNIPLTVNGKVDKRQLPEVDVGELHVDYVAPTTDAEKVIADVFASIFEEESIGLLDDFVRLGGDSIKAIRVISLLQKEGISCTARDILNYKTPYAIAQHISDDVQVSYGATEGIVDLLPIQSYFFDKVNKNDYIQSFIVESFADLDINILQNAWDSLTNLHDMLRVNYRVDDGNVIQEIMPLDTCVCEISEFDVSGDLNRNISEIMDKAIKSLDVYGKLMDISLVRSEGKSYLVFVIHHLIVDGVSWSTILDDLTHIYTELVSGGEIDLKRPYPYKSWVNDVKNLLESISDEEKEHWIEVNSLLDDSDIRGKAKYYSFTVDDADYDANNLLMLSEEELLALAIARSYKKTYDKDIIFNRESYGRDESLADVNRTVGWFTSKYPVIVDVSGDNDSTSLISDVYKLKKAFSEINNLGLNYASLIYTAHEFEYKQCPVTFNFLSTEFSFKNDLFQSIDSHISSVNETVGEVSDEDYHGIDLNVHHVGDDYIVRGYCADGTYIDDKLSEFIDNIKSEIDFITHYDFENGIICPLSEAQLGIYLDENVNDKGSAYNSIGFVECGSEYSIDNIKDAVIALTEKHPVLKARIVDEGDLPLMVCDNNYSIEIIDDIDNFELLKSFNLHQSLAHFYIIDASETKGIVYNIHHIINDANGSSIIKHDLTAALEGKLDNTPDLGFVYASRDSFESQFKPEYESAHEFFTEQFSEIDEANILLEEVNGASGEVSLPIRGIRNLVEDFTGANGITVGAFLNAVFAYTYSRFTGSEKVYYTFTEHGRHEEYSQNALGMFVRTIPILMDCKDNFIKNYLSDFFNLSLNSMINSVYPFRLLAREFNLIKDVLFEYNYDLNDVSDIGDELVIDELKRDAVSEFSCYVNDLNDGYLVKIAHSDKYSQDLAIRFVKVFKEILTQMLSKIRLSDIDYSVSDDLNVLDRYNQTENPLNYNDILDAFNESLRKYPDNPIVSFNDKSYTYAESAFIAGEIARKLIELGVKSQDYVSFLVERSEKYLWCILSILSAGGVYVPLDDAHPDERIEFLLEDTASKVVIVSDETYKRVKALVNDNILILNISDILRRDIKTSSSLPVVYGDLACILYTSGSSGIPKGVKVTRKSVINFSEFFIKNYNLTDEDVFALYASVGFDVAYESIFASICSGACINIVPNEIKLDMDAINTHFIEHEVTFAHLPAQVAKLFIGQDVNSSLKVLCAGGEKLGEIDINLNYRFVDTYGPTETFIDVTSIDVSDKIDDSSIGNLFDNTKAYILDNEKRRVPLGAVGELCIAGYPVADGYLNRDEETRYSFIDNPFDSDEDYSVLYRTGDMVKVLCDGTISFVGRKDNQVKIRGNRVELSEIEAIIRDLDYVKDTTVKAVKHENVNELVAYLVVSSGIDEDALRENVRDYVGEHKPAYMVPSFVIVLDSIPLTVNGKVDERALPNIDFESLHVEYMAPESETEKLVVNAFEKVFNHKVGIYDDFIRLGGDSLKAIQISSQLYKFGIKCNANSILNSKTPFNIAKSIDENKKEYGFYLAKKGSTEQNMF
ncbi:MAG: amino acid adenylation domain-containing protein, partial [Methanobrevibacter sp.]|nr:amino acid adenylation domain-containing protein [Methanobrevibacter sp.]